jgi:hypothetical protein
MKSIVNIGHNGLLVRVVAYLVEGEDFDHGTESRLTVI